MNREGSDKMEFDALKKVTATILGPQGTNTKGTGGNSEKTEHEFLIILLNC